MATRTVNPIPDGMHALNPQLWFNGDCLRAVEFYEKAFGALLIGDIEFSPDSRVMHAMLRIGDSTFFAADAMGSEYTQGPERYATASFYLYVQDSDRVFRQAVEAGCKVMSPIEDLFWGDRVGEVRDPFGHCWSIATKTRDVSLEELSRGREEWVEKRHGAFA